MTNSLAVKYMGLELSSPVIVGSCPLTISPESVRQFVGAGAGAIVLPSMLQEQIVYSQMQSSDPITAIGDSGYQPQQDKYNGGVENYISTIAELKQLERVPVIASLNGGSAGPWIEYAKRIEASGADALELNWQPIFADPRAPAAKVEQTLCDMVASLTSSLTIPVSVKLNQRFTNLASIAHQLQDAGAKGLAMFTHLPSWDVSIDRMHWTIHWELSPVNSLGSILEGLVRARSGGLSLSIAASGGVRTGEDAIKAMIAGAEAVMVTSELYRAGPEAICTIIDGIARYLERSPFDSVEAFQQARPAVQHRGGPMMRLEYIDPLTLSEHYFDPTPVVATQTCDAFGHPRKIGRDELHG